MRTSIRPLLAVACLSLAATLPASAGPGVLDGAWGYGGSAIYGYAQDDLAAMVRHADDRFVLVGLGKRDGVTYLLATRTLPNVTLDPAFGTDGVSAIPVAFTDPAVRDVAIDSLGRYLVLGTRNQNDVFIARLAADGTLDPTFGSGGFVTNTFIFATRARRILVDGSDRMLVAGELINGADEQFGVARFLANGALDNGFNTSGLTGASFGSSSSLVGRMMLDASGRIVLAGSCGDASLQSMCFVRVDANGNLDTSFNGTGRQVVARLDSPQALLSVETDLDASGRIVAASTAPGYVPEIVRLLPSGAIDTSFASPAGIEEYTTLFPSNAVAGMKVLADGRIFVAGNGSIDYDQLEYLVLPNGGLDTSFGNNPGSYLFSYGGVSEVRPRQMLLANGEVFVAAQYGTIGAVAWEVRTRNATTLVEGGSSFPPIDPLASPGRTQALAKAVGGYVLAGTAAPGTGVKRFEAARLQPDGQLDPTFGDQGRSWFSLAGAANAVVVDATNRTLLVGDSGTQVGVVRATVAGAGDTTYGPGGARTYNPTGQGASGRAAVLQPDGRLLIAGYATTSGVTRGLVMRLNTDGSLDTTFNGSGFALATAGSASEFHAIALQADGSVVAAGQARIGANDQLLVSRFTSAGAPDGTFGTSGNATLAVGTLGHRGNAVGLLADGRIVVGGAYFDGTIWQAALARLRGNGALDTTTNAVRTIALTGTQDREVTGLAVQSDSRIVVVGSAGAPGFDHTFYARFVSETLAPDAGWVNGGIQEDFYIPARTSVLVDEATAAVVVGVEFGNQTLGAFRYLLGTPGDVGVSVTGPAVLAAGQVGAFTVRITNNTGAPVTGFSLALTYSGLLKNAASGSTTCPGSLTALTGTNTATLGGTGAALANLASCTITLQLSSNAGTTGSVSVAPGSLLSSNGFNNAAGATQVAQVAGGATPASMTGSGSQSAPIGSAFGAPLSVTVRDAGNVPIPGVNVLFQAPGFGPTAALNGTTVTTDTNGVATVNATANMLYGTYSVTANVAGLPATTFSLTNLGSGGQLTLTQMGFGNTSLGTTANSPTITLSSVGNLPLTGISIGVTGAGFGTSTNCPATLAVGATCTVVATFHPVTEGQRSGSVTIASNAYTPIGILVSGTGVDLTNPDGDADGDGIPNGVEPSVNTNPLAKDNDVFANARLFAMQQYRDFLGREGDGNGISYWIGQVNATTRAQVIQGFFNSGTEFAGTVAPVARLYFAYFLRYPDYGGLLYHVNRSRANVPLAAISQDFATSAEFVSRYGALDDSDFIERVYQNVLGRGSDPGGKTYWLGYIQTHTRGEVMLGFSESDEFKAAIANEVFVTMMYVGMLRRAPDSIGFTYWVGYMDGGQSGLDLTNGFLASQEYHGRFLP